MWRARHLPRIVVLLLRLGVIVRLDRHAIGGHRSRPVFYVVKDDAFDHRTEIIDLWNAKHHLLVREVGIEVDR